MAVRENRLKLTPSVNNGGAEGALRPASSAEPKGLAVRPMLLAIVTTSSFRSGAHAMSKAPCPIGTDVTRSIHSRGRTMWFQRPMIGSSRFLCSKPSTPTLAGRQ